MSRILELANAYIDKKAEWACELVPFADVKQAHETLAAEVQKLEADNKRLVAALTLIATSIPSSGDLAYCKGIARAAIGETK